MRVLRRQAPLGRGPGGPDGTEQTAAPSGVALGTLGMLAARPYGPVGAYPYGVAYPYPPAVPQPPRIYLWCPAYQAYYPSVAACLGGWVRVDVPY
jgi:hypothetical protein